MELMPEKVQQEQEFDLREYVQAVFRRKWVVVGFTAALSVLVAIGTALQPKVYEAKASVLGGREAPRLIDFDPIPQDRFRERDYLKTQAAILTSRSLLQRAVKRLMKEGFYGQVAPGDVERRSMDLAKAVQLREKVVTAEDSQVIQITVEGGVPDRVARIANAIAEQYVADNLDQKRQMADQAVAWLEKKLAEAEASLKQSQTDLQAFKDREKITAPDEADPFATMGLTRLNDDYLATHIQRMQVGSRIEALKKARSQAPPAGAPSAAQSLNAEIQKQMRASLQKEYVDGQLQLKDLSQRYGEQHPDIITLKARLAKLERELQSLDEPEAVAAVEGAALPTGNLADLAAEYDALLGKERVLSRTLESHKAETRNLSRTGVTYTLLKQSVDLNDKTYNDLLSRLNSARMSGELKVSGIQILDRAEVPRAPVEPQPVRNMIVAVLLGLVLGVGLVLLMDTLDRRVKSPQDAARYLHLPLLTVVPGIGLSQGVGRDEGKAQLVTIQQPRSHAAECYRNLRTSILFSSGRPVPRTILVTSAVAGEGKSTTAANLAVVMAQSGRKTLLIDADLRRPALQRYFMREGNRGLIRVLKEGCRVEEAAQASGIENLDLLLCHGIPSNPSELLGSDRMRGLVDGLKDRYEEVIIDSPVVISVPDAIILAARAEAVILVHRPGATDREMVRHAREKLDEVNANILGLVMNNVNLKSQGYQYAEYLYYGYGAEGETKKGRKRAGKGKP
jgi:succinoglycan biosynthesis transport protein ExoP